MERSCDACAKPYEAKTARSRFCSANCRVRGHRGQVVAQMPPLGPVLGPETAAESPLVAIYRRDLAAAERLDTPKGQHVMLLAQTISSGAHTAAGMASLSRELREALADALAGAKVAADPLDEIAARREMKAAGA